jgi:glyoxalase family protein
VPLEGGIHHITAITADAPGNVDFYARALGLRLVKKTVNFDAPDVYHLYYGDERGSPGSILTFFEFPGAAPDVPEEHALLGFDRVHAYAADPVASAPLVREALGIADGRYAYDPPPAEPGVQGAGTVHHIAWTVRDDEELDAWRDRVTQVGARPTPIIDRTYFHSVYFREPSGVLFELATRGPGFDVDEPAESLGESLRLPERYEPLRPQLERTLTPLRNPRARSESPAS